MNKKTLLVSLLLSACVLGKAQYANQTLSNLIAPTAVNKDFRPGTHNAYNLGEPSKSWKNLSLTGVVYHKSEPFLRLLGTGGLFMGTNAGGSSIGSFNTGIGFKSLHYNTSGYSNSAIGYQTLYSNTVGNGNTASGYQSLYANVSGNENTAYGHTALFSNTTGYYNTATGSWSLFYNQTGISNTANGGGALFYNTSGSFNSAIGGSALGYNTTGYYNTAVGYDALNKNTIGGGNNAFGVNALYFNGRGSSNAAFGTATLLYLIEGFNNTAVGDYAGEVVADNNSQVNTKLNDCTFLGAYTTVGSTDQYNTTVVGYNARAVADNQVVIGNTNVNSIGGYANWTNFSDGRYKKNVKEDVPGLSFIKELRAVTYTLDIDGVNKTNPPAGKMQMPKDEKFAKFATVNEEASKKETELAKKAANEKSKIIYTGFLAQEVETAAKKLNYNFSGVKKPENDQDFYGLRYAEFVVPLVKAVQELSADNDEMKKQNDEIKTQNVALKVQNEKLETANEKLEARLAAIEQLLGAKNGLGLVTLSNNSLGQNIPNPANGKMTIPFNLSSAYQHASIVFTEVASGKVLKTIAVTAGQKTVTVQLDNMASGTYTYSLIAGNKTLDSKKMVVAR